MKNLLRFSVSDYTIEEYSDCGDKDFEAVKQLVELVKRR